VTRVSRRRILGDEMSKRTILWAVMLLVAFASGFGVGASLWKYSAADKLKELFGQREALQMVLSNQLDGWPVYSGEMIGEVRQSSSLVKSSDRLKPHPRN
jgi:hypothetical protein